MFFPGPWGEEGEKETRLEVARSGDIQGRRPAASSGTVPSEEVGHIEDDIIRARKHADEGRESRRWPQME